QKADTERLAARLQNRILRVGILREQSRQGRGRTQRPIGIGAARKWIIAAPATLLRQEQHRRHRERPQPSSLHAFTAFCRTSRSRRATIISSPGSSIHTPTTIVFSSLGSPAPGLRPVCGFSSMLGVPLRNSAATFIGEIFTRVWS